MSDRLEDHLTRIGSGLTRAVAPMRLTAQRAEELRASLAALAAHRRRAAVELQVYPSAQRSAEGAHINEEQT